MKIQEYPDWSMEVHERLAALRVPLNGAIEVTQRCNNRCIHCYNNLAANDRDALHRELSYKEHCRIIDQITHAGCLWLLFTGGEIFLRKDFLDIYTYAKQGDEQTALFGICINFQKILAQKSLNTSSAVNRTRHLPLHFHLCLFMQS